MFIFKYDKEIDKKNWERIISNGRKFGHYFPVNYEIAREDMEVANIKASEFANIWSKYEMIFKDKIKNIYKDCDLEKINCYINTSPYSSFNSDNDYISISFKKKNRRVVPSLLHEINHLLFLRSYKYFCASIGCTNSDIDKIKEFVTVINDDVFSPMQDEYWPGHEKYRELALATWREKNDLKRVVEVLKTLLDKEK